MNRIKALLMVGVFVLILTLVIAGVVQQNMNLTAVALALVSYLGWLTKSVIDGNGEDPP